MPTEDSCGTVAPREHCAPLQSETQTHLPFVGRPHWHEVLRALTRRLRVIGALAATITTSVALQAQTGSQCFLWTAKLINGYRALSWAQAPSQQEAANAAVAELNRLSAASVYVAGACAGLLIQEARNPVVLNSQWGTWDNYGRGAVFTGAYDSSGQPV